ncbi:MAG: hypothetical protein ACON4R_08135 [Akkermansiaceae bacterium]
MNLAVEVMRWVQRQSNLVVSICDPSLDYDTINGVKHVAKLSERHDHFFTLGGHA